MDASDENLARVTGNFWWELGLININFAQIWVDLDIVIVGYKSSLFASLERSKLSGVAIWKKILVNGLLHFI